MSPAAGSELSRRARTTTEFDRIHMPFKSGDVLSCRHASHNLTVPSDVPTEARVVPSRENDTERTEPVCAFPPLSVAIVV